MTWKRFFHRRHQDEVLSCEIDSYIEIETANNIARGMAPDEAGYTAQRKFGSMRRVREEVHRMNSLEFLETIGKDVKHALRMLRKSPAFTTVAILTLALGIGLNSLMFNLVYSILLRPLRGYEMGRVVMIFEKDKDSATNKVSKATINQWRQSVKNFDGIAVMDPMPMTLTGSGVPEVLSALGVTSDFFSVFHAAVRMGRTFLPGEDSQGQNSVVVLDYDYWQKRWGGNPGIVGKTIVLNNGLYTIIGVAPPNFHPLWLPATYDVYVPLSLGDDENYWVVAHLRSGASLASANAEMAAISDRLEAADPANNRGLRANIVPALETQVSQFRRSLLTLLCAAGLVLLIACFNVVGLILARTDARSTEFSVRVALGASPARLARQLTTEILVLALVGGALGLLLETLAIRILVAKLVYLPRLDELHLDFSTIAITFSVAIFACLCTCLGPALRTFRTAIAGHLQQHGIRGPAWRLPLRVGLTAGEVALSFVLVFATALLTQSLIHMRKVDLGYSPKNVLAFQLNLPPIGPDGGPELLTFYDSVGLRIRAIPSVLSAGFTSETPMSFGIGMYDNIDIVGRPKKPGKRDSAILKVVDPDYFRVLEIPVLSGRAFTSKDDPGAQPVALIDLSLARRCFPGRSPIGQYLNVARIDPNLQADLGSLPRSIIGVVGDVREASLAGQQLPEIYLPLAQNPMRFVCVAVRAERNPVSLVDPIRQEVARVNAQVPVFAVRSMDWLASYLFVSTRDTDDLFSFFALLALLLSALGVYGLLSYSMHQRVQEIGIRVALGAQTRDILRLALTQACGIIGWGIGTGVILSLGLARFLSALLFQARPANPALLCSVTVILILVVVAACYIPARRAMRVDPIAALRHE